MTRGDRRKQDYRKAKRKVDILEAKGIDGWFKCVHQASKGKAHCSCPLCSCKTRQKGKKDNWSARDKKRMANWKM